MKFAIRTYYNNDIDVEGLELSKETLWYWAYQTKEWKNTEYCTIEMNNLEELLELVEKIDEDIIMRPPGGLYTESSKNSEVVVELIIDDSLCGECY